MLLESQCLDDEAIKKTCQEIGEIKASRLRIRQLTEAPGTGEKLVAVDAGQALDTCLCGQDAIDLPIGAAVRVGDEYAPVAVPGACYLGPQSPGNQRRAEMQPGVDAPDVQMAPATDPLDRLHLPRQGAAGDDQYGFRFHWPSSRAAIRPVAVSTAVAASRQ